MAKMSELMNNCSRELFALLSYVCGYQYWSIDTSTMTATVWQDDDDPYVEGLISTDMWIDDDEEGIAWLYFRSRWEEGNTVTGVGRLYQVGHYSNAGLVI